MGSSKRNEEPSKGGSSRAGRKTGLLKFAWRATKSRTFGKASADDQQPKIMNVVAGPSNHSTDADRVEVAIASATTAASSEAADASEACRKNDILAAKAEEAASTVKESLWDLAYDKLREEKPCVVEAYEELLARMLPYLAAESPATDLRDLLSKASSRHQSDSSAATKHDSAAYSVMTRREKMDDMIALGKKHMEGKKIALKVGDQEFVLQDQMKHVVAGLRIAKAWVDDAVNASPLARTAWASVCLLLPFLTNQSDVQAANDEGFAYVTQKIRYYAAMESLLFGADDTTFPPAFRDHVVGLYKEIIDFQAQTVLRFFRGRFSNFVRDTVRCDPWENMLKRVKELGANVEKESLHINSAMARDALGVLAKWAIKTEEDKCLQSLRRGDYAWYKDRVEERAPDTCLWFLTHESYQSWLKADSGPLLVSADPGCGKSVLAKYLIDSRFGFTLPKEAAICYFFFKEADQCTVEQALCALIHQLLCLRPTLVRHALPRYKQDGDKLASNVTALWDILEMATADPEAGTVVIVLDALDECLQDERNMPTLSRYITTHFAKGRRRSLKILMTARPYEGTIRAIQALERTFPNIRIKGEDDSETIRKEINSVIEYQVDRLDKFNDDSRLKPHLKKRLMDITHRTYLWLYLILKHLEDPTIRSTVGGLDEAIQNLPSSVDHAYENILGRSTKPEETRKALCILLAAYRPLTLLELQRAMRITTNTKDPAELDLESDEAFKQRLRELCGLFVTEHDGRVYFLHQTAREFLLRPASSSSSSSPYTDATKWVHSISIRDAHMALAEACVVNLSLPEPPWPLNVGHNFWKYSVENWVYHFRLAGVVEGAAVFPYAAELCNPNSRWLRNKRANKMTFFDKLTALIIASLFGLEAVVQLLLKNGAEIESSDQQGRTPLSWAAEKGREAVVRLLLDGGAEVDSKDQRGRTPLSWAAARGHETVVWLLLEKGAEIESRDQQGRTPLSWATENGCWAVVQLLLEKGAKIESTDEQGRTPLSWAAQLRWFVDFEWMVLKTQSIDSMDQEALMPSQATEVQEAAMRLLLQNGAEIDSRDHQGRTPLSFAAATRHRSAAQLLLEKGAEIESRDQQGWTPLSWAAADGCWYMVQLLLEKGAKIESRDEQGRTPLSLAVENGHGAVVELLFKNGAEIEDQRVQMLLLWAAERGYEAVVRLLLVRGADIESRNQEGRTPLSLAAAGGHGAAVQQLLEKGAEIESRDQQGQTPLSLAAVGGHEAVVQQLLEKGAEIESRDQQGQTPLSLAAAEGCSSVVRLLLESGADAESRDHRGRTPLSLVTERWQELTLEGQGWPIPFVEQEEECEDVVHLLLEKGAEIDSKDQQVQTLLCWAAENGHAAVVRLLLEKGAETESRDQYGQTPLILACEKGHKDVVRLLLEKGAEIESRDQWALTPLSCAAAKGHKAVAQLLLEMGAKIESRDQRGRTPLSWAAARGHVAAVRLLLEKGAKIESTDHRGRTPLSLAAEGLHAAMMRQLIKDGSQIEWEDEQGRTRISGPAETQEVMVRLLLENGAQVESRDQCGRTPLSWAAEAENYPMVSLLLKSGAEIESRDQQGRTPLSWAATHAWKDSVVRLLLRNGAEVESRDQEGRTPLSWAAAGGRETLIRLLLENGADIESRDQQGRTPLCVAAARGHEAALQVLLEKGAEIGSRDQQGRTPLSWAAAEGHEAVIKLLRETGADIESRDQEGRTPLFWASAEGREAVIRLLLEKGAEIESRDQQGWTPLYAAAARGHEAAVQLLLENNAEIELRDQQGRTPLSCALAEGHEAVARLLKSQAM